MEVSLRPRWTWGPCSLMAKTPGGGAATRARDGAERRQIAEPHAPAGLTFRTGAGAGFVPGLRAGSASAARPRPDQRPGRPPRQLRAASQRTVFSLLADALNALPLQAGSV